MAQGVQHASQVAGGTAGTMGSTLLLGQRQWGCRTMYRLRMGLWHVRHRFVRSGTARPCPGRSGYPFGGSRVERFRHLGSPVAIGGDAAHYDVEGLRTRATIQGLRTRAGQESTCAHQVCTCVHEGRAPVHTGCVWLRRVCIACWRPGGMCHLACGSTMIVWHENMLGVSPRISHESRLEVLHRYHRGAQAFRF